MVRRHKLTADASTKVRDENVAGGVFKRKLKYILLSVWH